MLRTDLPPLVAALLDAPAWVTPSQLALHLGKEESYVTDQLCDLDLEGWITVSDRADSPVVTLSMRAIVSLGLELVRCDGSFRWRRVPDRRPDPHAAEDEPPPVERVTSGELGPVATAVFAEEMGRLVARRIQRRLDRGLPLRPEDVAYPSIMYMGHALWPWTEVDAAPRPSVYCRRCQAVVKSRKVLRMICDCGRGLRRWPTPPVCPGCKDEDMTLRYYHYCLRDNRWGWDHVFHPKPKRADQDRPDQQTA